MVVHGEDFIERVFVGVDVYHPTEDDWLEAAVRFVASFLRGDGAPEAELAHVGAA